MWEKVYILLMICWRFCWYIYMNYESDCTIILYAIQIHTNSSFFVLFTNMHKKIMRTVRIDTENQMFGLTACRDNPVIKVSSSCASRRRHTIRTYTRRVHKHFNCSLSSTTQRQIIIVYSHYVAYILKLIWSSHILSTWRLLRGPCI